MKKLKKEKTKKKLNRYWANEKEQPRNHKLFPFLIEMQWIYNPMEGKEHCLFLYLDRRTKKIHKWRRVV
ncbi:hypothetical protein CL634_03130 [bacterium]|nr:hypothetical protein [bacterium]|tara:strand:+ start:236 stop:442 length:207 start_codon:yes stop_codon:yes gene_type:complete